MEPEALQPMHELKDDEPGALHVPVGQVPVQAET